MSDNNQSVDVKVNDDDIYSPDNSRQSDDLDGDVNISVNIQKPQCVCRCNPCVCKVGYHVYQSRCCNHGHSHHAHYENHAPPISIRVDKSKTEYNFGQTFVPVGYFNNQGGGQGASVTGAQQTIEKSTSAPCGCVGNTCGEGISSDGSGDETVVHTHIHKTYNENYNTNSNTNHHSHLDCGDCDPCDPANDGNVDGVDINSGNLPESVTDTDGA